jgi:hypothetical protein
MLVDRCVAKEPSQRFGDAAGLVDALEQAQLAGPEVPLPVRMLANELGTIGLVFVFTALIGWFIVSKLMAADIGQVDLLIPVVVLATVVIARLGQALSEARRLRQLGFDVHAVQAGLRGVVDEADAVRAAARVDPQRLAERRRAVRVGWLMLAIGVASIAMATTFRVLESVGSTRHRTTALGLALLFNGLACGCVAFVLWLRSPLKMPLGERVFRAFWLRGPGKGLLSLAMGRSSSTIKAERPPVTTAKNERRPQSPGTPDAQWRELAQRVEALEQWRQHHESGGTANHRRP